MGKRGSVAVFSRASLTASMLALFVYGWQTPPVYPLRFGSTERRPGQLVVSLQASGSEELHFRFVLQGYGKMKGGTFCLTEARSEDGVQVERRVETFKSASLSQRAMKTIIATAREVLQRGPRREDQGKGAEERAVILVAATRRTETDAVVLWTEGPELYILRSHSLRHVLAFERQVFLSPPPPNIAGPSPPH